MSWPDPSFVEQVSQVSQGMLALKNCEWIHDPILALCTARKVDEAKHAVE